MNFEFSDEQLQLRDEVRRFLAAHSGPALVRRCLDGGPASAGELWQEMAKLGLIGIAIPEEHGGTGAGALELCVVAEELGRALAPLPFASTVYLGTDLINRSGTEAQRRAYLARIAAGELTVSLAFAEGPGNPSPHAVGTAATRAGRLTGVKWPVLDGNVAGLAIVLARDEAGGGLSLFLAETEAPGVSREALDSLDPTRGQARIAFADVPAQRLGTAGEGWVLLDAAFDRAAVPLAFEQVGGAERVLEMARQYALDRMAFGRPIGSFQAIKHKLVDMYVATVLARCNAYFGAWALSAGSALLPRAAAAARVSATEAYRLCAKESIQVHGGMGFTWESDCHIHYRRAHLLGLVLGGLPFWQDRLVAQLRRELEEAA